MDESKAPTCCPVKAVALDFGGVLAEEGYRAALAALAADHGKDPQEVISRAEEALFRCGYLTGACGERTYWEAFRDATDIEESDRQLRSRVLDSFSLRPFMVDLVVRLRHAGIPVVLLSDQTNWLSELDERTPFFHLFDRIFNSFRTGRTKRDPEAFREVLRYLNLPPEATLFVDDRKSNVETARSLGMQAILYTDRDSFYQAFWEHWI